MGSVQTEKKKSKIAEKIDDLKKSLDKFNESAQGDQNLLAANSLLIKEKEDLEERLKIQELNLRRELKTVKDENIDLRERLRTTEIELSGLLERYKERLG